MQRRLVIKLDVVKWVCDDLGEPDEPGLDVLEKHKMYGSEQQTTEANGQPYLPHMLYEINPASVRRKESKQGGVEPQ
jgi:hypothetical protein